MKSCPKCNQTYTDETLNFCLDDGSTLSLINNALFENQEIPTIIRHATPLHKSKTYIKTTLLIFLFMAIPLTLFPPYNWGDELLQTETSKNSRICEENEDSSLNKDVLPIKQYDFVFGNDKQKFETLNLDKGESSFLCFRVYLTLQRKLIISELILEYIIAFLAAFIIQTIIQKFFAWRNRS